MPYEKRLYSYLEKRRRRWYAVMEIPKRLRPRFGKARFVQSLGTESRTEAERKVHAVIGAWKEQLGNEHWPSIDYSIRGKTYSREVQHPAILFQKLGNAKTEEKRQAILLEIEDAASHIGAINVENIGDPPTSDTEAQDYSPWREVEVPLSMTFKGLHETIQAAFLWFDSHLWEFEFASRRYGIPFDEDFGGDKVYNANSTRLVKLRDSGVKEFLYTYDMGDNWEHHIEVIDLFDAPTP